jgi:hypothetical protein
MSADGALHVATAAIFVDQVAAAIVGTGSAKGHLRNLGEKFLAIKDDLLHFIL